MSGKDSDFRGFYAFGREKLCSLRGPVSVNFESLVLESASSSEAFLKNF